MKLLAALLIVCIVFLSVFAGSLKAVPMPEKADCCAKTEKDAHCPKESKKHQEDNCEKYGCSMLLTCSLCGFLMVDPVSIESAAVIFTENPIPTYKTGNTAVYLPSDWKPPKV